MQIYTGYHILENYGIHYVHESYHYSQLVDVEVDQVSHNRLDIEYIILALKVILLDRLQGNICSVIQEP